MNAVCVDILNRGFIFIETDQYNEVLFCNISFTSLSSSEQNLNNFSYNLGHVFKILNECKEQKLIESYSVSQTTLEQIFVRLAGEDEKDQNDKQKNKRECKFFWMTFI